MTKTCSTCGFFCPTEHLRPDLQQEFENADFQGACLELSNNFIFLPMIHRAEHARCGKWMKYVNPTLRANPDTEKILALQMDE